MRVIDINKSREALKRYDKKFLFSLICQYVSKIATTLLGLVTISLTARYLGPSKLGLLSYVTSLAAILQPLGDIGVSQSYQVLLSQDRDFNLTSTALLLRLASTLLFGLAIAPFAFASNSKIVIILFLLTITSNFFSSFDILQFNFFQAGKGVQIALIQSVLSLSRLVYALLAVFTKSSIIVFGSLNLFQSILKSILFLVIGKFDLIHGSSFKLSISLSYAKKLLQLGFPLMLSGIAIMVYMRSDQVMLEWLVGSKDLGMYSVAVKLLEAVYLLPLILSKNLFPKLSIEISNSKSQLSKIFSGFRILSVLLTIAVFVSSTFIIKLLFGEVYLGSASVLRILSLCIFPVAMGTLLGDLFKIIGEQNIILKCSCIGAVLNIIMNLILIPSYGMIGAAIATVTAQYISVFCVPLISNNTRMYALKAFK